MENLTPMETAIVVIGVVMVLASAINTLGSAAEKIVKAYKAYKAPDVAQDSRLDTLEKEMQEVKTKLGNDYRHLEALDEGNRVTQKALLALLAHGLDGNAVEQMKDAKKALEAHLINR